MTAITTHLRQIEAGSCGRLPGCPEASFRGGTCRLSVLSLTAIQSLPGQGLMPLPFRASQKPGPAVYAVEVAALAVVYYAAARLGLRYATIGQSISLVWPPTGLALAALILLGRRAWPGIAVGAFFANAATSVKVIICAHTSARCPGP